MKTHTFVPGLCQFWISVCVCFCEKLKVPGFFTHSTSHKKDQGSQFSLCVCVCVCVYVSVAYRLSLSVSHTQTVSEYVLCVCEGVVGVVCRFFVCVCGWVCGS